MKRNLIILLTTLYTILIASDIDLLTQKCEKGDAESCYQLGMEYADSNYTKSMKYALKACEGKHAYACRAVGNMYKQGGTWIKQDFDKYIYYYGKTCEYGDNEVCFLLGKEFEEGTKVKQNKTKAVEYYTKACNENYAEACLSLGLVYSNIYTPEHNTTKALKLFQKACDNNNTKGCKHTIAIYYKEGKFKNKAKIEYLLDKVCNLNDYEGCEWFGEVLEKEKKYIYAFSMYKKACNGKNGSACHNLANFYYYGKGVKQDYPKAIQLYLKAHNWGQHKGLYTIGVLYYTGKGVDKNDTKAFQFFQKSCDSNTTYAEDLNSKMSCFNLAVFHENGIGGAKKSHLIAIRKLKKSCARGYEEACKTLKAIENNEQKVEQNSTSNHQKDIK